MVTQRVLLPRVAAARACVHVEAQHADEAVPVGLHTLGAARVVGRGGEVVTLPREVDAHLVRERVRVRVSGQGEGEGEGEGWG